MGRKNLLYDVIIPARGEFGKWHPGWGREYWKAFLRCSSRTPAQAELFILLLPFAHLELFKKWCTVIILSDCAVLSCHSGPSKLWQTAIVKLSNNIFRTALQLSYCAGWILEGGGSRGVLSVRFGQGWWAPFQESLGGHLIYRIAIQKKSTCLFVSFICK